MQHGVALGRLMLANARDVLPVVAVIAFFQGALVGKPLPQLTEVLVGLAFTLVGLTLFVRGLGMSLFVLGQDLADAIARRGNLAMLLLFAFALGFGSTIAEPALFSVVDKATAAAATAGILARDAAATERFAFLLQYSTSAAVGCSLVIGCLRIVASVLPNSVAVAACLSLRQYQSHAMLAIRQVCSSRRLPHA